MLPNQFRQEIATPRASRASILCRRSSNVKIPEKPMKVEILGLGSRSLRSLGASRLLVAALALGTIFFTAPRNLGAFQDSQDSQQQVQPDQGQVADQSGQGDQSNQGQAPPAYNTQTPAQLQQLVAPIALYPDSLVAQVLAASTFPAEIVEADRWVQANPNLKGDALAQAVDQQNWDPSVKALTAFPSVLANMDKNLSWTSSLGDAYYNQQNDVMDAVQVMRQKAQSSGNLQSTDQQTVQSQGSTIVIQPANPEVVYVPAYNPWVVYGGPIAPWPFWYPTPGIWWGGPHIYWGVGFGVGFYGGYGWGWHNWNTNWNNHVVVYNHNTYYSHSTTFYNRNNYYRNGPGKGYNDHGVNEHHPTGFNGNNAGRGNIPGAERDNGAHGNVYNHPGATPQPFDGNRNEARGYPSDQNRNMSGRTSSAFSNQDHGGESRSFSSRGANSMGGGSRGAGGGFGGGGSHGGGGGGGGRHR
jgi:uncharacterized membrane protein YgcG